MALSKKTRRMSQNYLNTEMGHAELCTDENQAWFSILSCPWGEILKRPMKQVQGMVQDEGRRNFKCSILEIL